MPDVKRVMIIGLDCAEPSLVLGRFRDQLPTLSALADSGAYGRLESVVPPITVPAWSCMMSSRTPGDLGIYGFRNRADHSYDGLFIANGSAVKEPRLWDIVGRRGLRSIVLGVPGTFPVRPLNGLMVSCFLTPSTQSQYTFPPALRNEVEDVVGEYLFDCTEFRTEDKDDLLRQIYEMTDKRFELADHFLSTKPWELFAMVEMGTDRIHHGFWKDMDPAHRKHVPGGAYEQAILDYYVHVDGLVANLLRHADDETAVLIVSDHGAKRMDGGIRINEWLRREGLLGLQREPEGRSSTRECGIDWSRTKVWAEGGYYSRVFLNVEGREPEGTIPAADYERFRDELIARISAIPDDQGRPIPTRVFRPEDVYPEIKGIAPDLIVHFGDLYWRAVGTVGGDEGLYTFDNDTGPDDANHAQHGMFILRAPGVEPGLREGAHLLDVAPTVLELLGQPVPPAMRGASLLERVTA
ncbi:MAG: alkaline phosphatase family protein [Actinomycetota bacterium]|nr:alkaline phosphatase family protein [Actinomycetota bacterium]